MQCLVLNSSDDLGLSLKLKTDLQKYAFQILPVHRFFARQCLNSENLERRQRETWIKSRFSLLSISGTGGSWFESALLQDIDKGPMIDLAPEEEGLNEGIPKYNSERFRLAREDLLSCKQLGIGLLAHPSRNCSPRAGLDSR